MTASPRPAHDHAPPATVRCYADRRRAPELLAFVRKHHYTRSASPVFQFAYALENQRGAIRAAMLFGPPHTPAVRRGFCHADYAEHMLYNQRLVAKGTSSADLDRLLQAASEDLGQRGYWWLYTLVDPRAQLALRSPLRSLLSPGFSGDLYSRNGYLFCGYTQERSHTEYFLVDGARLGPRQGPRTLSLDDVRTRYPHSDVRRVLGHAKARWTRVLPCTEAELSTRLLLLHHKPVPLAQQHPQPIQPRLLCGPQPLQETRHAR